MPDRDGPRFADLFRSGLADADSVDDHVGRWHAGAGPGLALHEYLGMTPAEYARWAEGGDLREILSKDKEEPL